MNYQSDLLEEKEIWETAKKEMKEALQKKRKWITYFMNQVIARDIKLANRRAANKYTELFRKRIKEQNKELYYRIYNELIPKWNELQDKREVEVEIAKKQFIHPKYQGMITNGSQKRDYFRVTKSSLEFKV